MDPLIHLFRPLPHIHHPPITSALHSRLTASHNTSHPSLSLRTSFPRHCRTPHEADLHQLITMAEATGEVAPSAETSNELVPASTGEPASSAPEGSASAKPVSAKPASAKPKSAPRSSVGAKKAGASKDNANVSHKIGDIVLGHLRGFPAWRELLLLCTTDSGANMHPSCSCQWPDSHTPLGNADLRQVVDPETVNERVKAQRPGKGPSGNSFCVQYFPVGDL